MLNALKYDIISFVRLLVRAWLRGQAVKTSPFHGGNTGSIPVGVILACRYGFIGKVNGLSPFIGFAIYAMTRKGLRTFSSVG